MNVLNNIDLTEEPKIEEIAIIEEKQDLLAVDNLGISWSFNHDRHTVGFVQVTSICSQEIFTLLGEYLKHKIKKGETLHIKTETEDGVGMVLELRKYKHLDLSEHYYRIGMYDNIDICTFLKIRMEVIKNE